MVSLQGNTLVIGQKQYNVDTLQIQVEQDIAFLKSRISTLQQHEKLNAESLKNYHNMVESRQLVLDWLHKRAKSVG